MNVLMEKKALLVQKVCSEDVFWLTVLTKQLLDLTVMIFPQVLGGLEVLCVAGVGSAQVFSQKPPALPAWRAICLAKTLFLSCRCRPLPVSPCRPAETSLLQLCLRMTEHANEL